MPDTIDKRAEELARMVALAVAPLSAHYVNGEKHIDISRDALDSATQVIAAALREERQEERQEAAERVRRDIEAELVKYEEAMQGRRHSTEYENGIRIGRIIACAAILNED